MILKIDNNLKIKCWKYLKENNLGNRHSANGNKEQQFVGLIGEIITKKYFGIEHKWLKGFDGGYDFIYNNKKIDVKTMGRNVTPKDFYVNNFISFQKDFDCDYYILTSLNKKTNELFICGYLSKTELLDKAILYKKGAIRHRENGTTFKMKADTFEIKNNLLNKIKNFKNEIR